MRWITPKKRDQEIRVKTDPIAWSDFNAPLGENDGRPCLVEVLENKAVQASCSDADDDIRAGRVKQFDNPDDMIASLKQPW